MAEPEHVARAAPADEPRESGVIPWEVPAAWAAFGRSGRSFAVSSANNGEGSERFNVVGSLQAGNGVPTWSRQIQIEGFRPSAAAFTYDAKRLVVGAADGRLKVFRAESMQPLDEFRQDRIRRQETNSGVHAHWHPISAVAIDPDSGHIITGDATGAMRLWSGIGEPVKRYRVGRGAVTGLRTYGSANTLLATSEAGGLVLLTPGSPRPTPRQYATCESQPMTLTTGRSGKGVVIGEANGQVRLWMESGKRLEATAVQAHDSPIVAAELLRDDSTLVTAAGNGQLTRWTLPLPAAKAITISRPRPEFLAADAKGQMLAVPGEGSEVLLYRITTGELVQQLTVPADGLPVAASFSADGKRFAVGDSMGRILLFTVSTQTTDRLQPVEVTQVDTHPVRSLLLAGSDANSIIFGTDGGVLGRSSFPHAAGDTGAAPATAEDARATAKESGWTRQLDHPIEQIAVGSGGKELLVATPQGGVRRFALKDAAEGPPVPPIGARIRAIVPCGDAGQAMLLREDGRLCTDDGKGGIIKEELPSGELIRSLAVSPDRSRLAAVTRSNRLMTWTLRDSTLGHSLLPLDFSADEIVFASHDLLVLSPVADAVVRVTSAHSQRIDYPGERERVTDMALLGDESYLAVADGSSCVQLMEVIGGRTRSLSAGGMAVDRLAAQPRGEWLAGSGQRLSSGRRRPEQQEPAGRLAIWDTSSGKEHVGLDLPSRCTDLLFSDDGQRLVLALANQQAWLIDVATGERLQRFQADAAIRCLEFSTDGRFVLLGLADGTVVEHPIFAVASFAGHESVVSQLQPLRHGLVASAGGRGEIKIWQLADPREPLLVLQGPVEHAVTGLACSADGSTVLALFGTEDRQVRVWQLGLSPAGTAGWSAAPDAGEPIAIWRDTGARVAALSPDGKLVVTGGDDGMIRGWSVIAGDTVAQFTGHSGEIAGLAWTATRGEFVSAASDQTIRRWRFPSLSANPSERVASGVLVETTNLDVTPRKGSAVVTGSSGDVWAELRDRLSAAESSLAKGLLFTEYPGSSDARKELKDRFEAMRQAERRAREAKGRSLSQLAEIAATRRDFYHRRHELMSANGISTASEGQQPLTENLLFRTDIADRPASPELSHIDLAVGLDGFLYVLRTPSSDSAEQQPRRAVDRSVSCWDFGYSGLEVNRWIDPPWQLEEIHPSPDGSGAFTLPDFAVFSHDGTSQFFSPRTTAALSPPTFPGDRPWLAVASSNGSREKGMRLRILDGSRLSTIASSVAECSIPEGVVTAIAIANDHSRVAYAVRHETTQRLYIADPVRLPNATPRRVAEFDLDGPYGRAELGRSPQGAPGVTSLAFSPNDNLLIAHGNFGRSGYRLMGWKLSWTEAGTIELAQDETAAETAFAPITDMKEPLIIESGSQPLRFIEPTTRTAATSSAAAADWLAIPAYASLLVAEVPQGIAVSDVRKQQQKRLIEFPRQASKPPYAISADGRWLIMGAEDGEVFLWNLFTGIKTRVNMGKHAAHDASVLAVALSETDPLLGVPAYAATVDQNMEIRVWDVIPPVARDLLPR